MNGALLIILRDSRHSQDCLRQTGRPGRLALPFPSITKSYTTTKAASGYLTSGIEAPSLAPDGFEAVGSQSGSLQPELCLVSSPESAVDGHVVLKATGGPGVPPEAPF